MQGGAYARDRHVSMCKPTRQYDAQRLGGVVVDLRSHLLIERQTRTIGATRLNQQLIGGGSGLGDLGDGMGFSLVP